MVVVFAAVLLLVVVLVLWWSWPASPDEPIDSIAVLPFENATGSEENGYLSVGIAESVSFRLARLSGLRVVSISPERLSDYKGKEVDAQEADRELGVAAALVGRLSDLNRRDGLPFSNLSRVLLESNQNTLLSACLVETVRIISGRPASSE